MAGTFTVGERKIRPGVYHRYENAGGIRLAGAINGIGAGVIRANWGPLNKVIEFEPSTKVSTIYGSGNTEDLITEMFTGGLTSGFFVRVGSGGTAPTLVLQLEDGGEAGTITGAYVGDRAFTASIRDSIITDQRECIIYEGTTEFLKVSFDPGENEPAALKAAMAKATKDFFFLPAENATGALAETVQAEFVPGTNPTTTNADYSNAFDALEPCVYNVICLDTDSISVQMLLDAYLDRVYEAGNYPMCTIAADSSKELEDRMTIAKSFKDPKITYVLNSAVDAAGRKYEGYQIAARIGGIIASTPANQSVTHEVVTNMIDLDKPLTNTEIIRALKSGCIVLTKNNDGQVWIEQGINTLITPNAEQDEGWKKIRRVKTRFELMQRMDNTLEKIIGKANNDPDGRATVIAAGNKLIKLMFREGKLLDGGYMMEDPSNPPEGDSAWFIIAVDDVDSIEFVYLLYRYRFAPETSE